MKRPAKYRKVTIAIASSRCNELEMDISFQLSQIVPSLTDCENCTVNEVTSNGSPKIRVWFENCSKSDVPVLGLAGCHWREMKNEKWRRYTDWHPNLYHQIKWVSSRVAVSNDLPLPPAQIEVLHLFRCSTHTHSRGRVGKLRSGQWDEDENERK